MAPYSFRRDAGVSGDKHRQFRKRLTAYRQARSAGRPRRQIPRAAVPSFFTLMNLFSGFLALIQVYEGRFEYAAWLIVLAAFFDVLDGMMARLTSSTSLFGIELDSLADIVSFGVAPAFLVYVFGLRELGMLGLVVAALPAICGAVRLARFNVNFMEEKKDFFVGLPIPGMAIMIVALILNFSSAEWFSRFSMGNLSVLVPVVILLSFLMISNIPFDAVPKPSTQYLRAHPRKASAYSLGFLLVIFLQQIGLLFVLSVYIVLNVGRAVYVIARDIAETPTDEEAAGAGRGGEAQGPTR
jgi:CDP-diacylglycerol---serine O-phosphatidyltransferase